MSDDDFEAGSEGSGAARASRRGVLAGAVALASAMSLSRGAAAADEKSADFLFVQTAKGMAYDTDQNRLTLRQLSPVTLFFSDRPERVAGNMKTADFVPFWSDGKDSFLSDPPNADISILEDGKLRQTVAVLQDPKLEGEDSDLYRQDHQRRDASARGGRVGLHRRDRHAADAGLLRRRRPARLPAGRHLSARAG